MSEIPTQTPAQGPIADLTYRTYTGPLSPPVFRWWAIAKMTMRLAVKKKAFWGWGITSCWNYILMLGVLTLFEQRAGDGPEGEMLNRFFDNVKWNTLFLDGYLASLFMLFLCTLTIASGNIAADNKANALLVYLSKPATKTDYLLGKWTGFFLLLLGVCGVPMMLVYGYGLLSFRQYGFLTQDPWMFPKLLVLMSVAPALLSSVAVGISSQFNQPRIATAAFAGAYFLPMVVSYVMFAIIRSHDAGDSGALFSLYYAHLAGLEEGIGKSLLNTSGGFANLLFGGGRDRGGDGAIGPPTAWIVWLSALGVIAASWFLAWRRVRAVEVIGS